MIGVLAPPNRQSVAREFFELFKTAWEFYQPSHAYDAVLSTTGEAPPDARILLVYGSRRSLSDPPDGSPHQPCSSGRVIALGGDRFPLYGGVGAVGGDGEPLGTDPDTGEAIARIQRGPDQIRVRLGFDLFEETELLLRGCQPIQHAGVPTLDLHISFLRDLLLNLGLQLSEIPPVPSGYAFISCVTHDVDHPAIRFHRFDHTVLGFLRRALFDSPLQACRGRIPIRHALRNAAAAAKLPLVFAGWAADPWAELERYLEIERGWGSTFFVLPVKGDPGRALEGSGRAPTKRASPYAAADLEPRISRLLAGGCEVGLHGLDAWADADRARAERRLIPAPPHAGETGVRMHWLYFNEASPARLEAGGFSYDSTVGYNATVGYRAGTTQIYRPLNAQHLLELPLHVMDTALFYPSYLNLSDPEARRYVAPLLDAAVRHGGVLTINWHDRSIAPERLWDEFYRWLLAQISDLRAWRPTAATAVAWFRWRRSATFRPGSPDRSPDVAVAPVRHESLSSLPPLQLRIHAPRNGLLEQPIAFRRSGPFKDRELLSPLPAPQVLASNR